MVPRIPCCIVFPGKGNTMKRLIIASLLAFVSAPFAQAGGTFGLFTCKPCNSCGVCIRPYNAFTPVCVGNYNGDIMSMPGNCMQGGCAKFNSMDGSPVQIENQLPMGVAKPGIKGAYLLQGNPANYYPVYMQNGYQVPVQVVPYGAGPAMLPMAVPQVGQ